MSETYADLGGGTSAIRPIPTPGHRCRPDPVSGWCGCGRRDDGKIAVGSPAWRALLTPQAGG